jgi:hypothetical protein
MNSMSTPARRILYCHCAFAKVVPTEVKSAVLEGLSRANVEFEAVPDLCEMAARRRRDRSESPPAIHAR